MYRDASTDSANSVELIGIDDGPFSLTPSREDGVSLQRFAPLVATQLNGAHIVRVSTGRIIVDGMDGTRVAQRLLDGFPRLPVLLSGVTYGGFNLIDPRILERSRRTPTIVVIGSKPRNYHVKSALRRHFPDWERRWMIIRSLGPVRKLRTLPNEPAIYYERFGCPISNARQILRGASLVSRIPEPIRVAGMIARGLNRLPAISA